MMIVGVDVGGTFTDLILFDEERRDVRIAKVPTTVENQAFGVLAALAQADADLASLGAIVHGTTTTTNALLERKIARVGLITTRGFRDVLELGRRTRPLPYGLIGTFEPLIPRELRLEVGERIDSDGAVLRSLDREAVLLAGPNGAGKTTLLLLILGVLTPDAGRISIGGQVIFDILDL
jgi:N-methylhydantoinase A